ncbi:MAG: PTS sugar transporter subunit IIA [Candidatus Latescibacteria bacterium]|jgi:nitrogen PTS system EIIA component|nr:PTS sugar transporter subunit IIA [Candidatus Latescibacterota bacterium]
MIKIFNLLTEDRIRILDTQDKNEAITEICRMLATADTITDADEMENAIFERENIISTSIGLGIAIPHVRLKSVTDLTMAIGIVKEGIDYKSFDDLPVNIIIMIAAPEGSHREYLSVLAKIALLLKNDRIRESILDAESSKEVYDVLKEH